jgi:hypothetical protein
VSFTFTFLLLTKYYSGEKIKKNEMGGACGTCGKEEKYIKCFGGGDVREIKHLEDPNVDGSVILKWIVKKWRGMDWIDLA